MNRLRSDFSRPKDKEINITPYWLLGFLEGVGCFSINRRNNFRLDFSISQSSTNLELMQEIKIYLENISATDGNSVGTVGIYAVRSNNPNHQSTTRIETTRIPFIANIFIPIFFFLGLRCCLIS